MRNTSLITILAAVSLAALVGTGCAKYTAKPLSPATVGQALAVPDAGALRVAAADLRHPILQPVTLDPARGLSPDEVAWVEDRLRAAGLRK